MVVKISDNLKAYKNKIYLCFYKAKTPWQKLLCKLFNFQYCSICLYIDDCAYTFRHWEMRIKKEEYWNSSYMESKYVMVDTKFKASDLKEGWEDELLKQKARALDSLFLRHRCVKSTRFILEQLDKKWRYRFGDMFVNIYYKRRIK